MPPARRPRASAPVSKAPHAAHAHLRRGRSRQAPRRPRARACGGRCERPRRGLNPPRPAGSGHGGGAATVLGPATGRQTTRVSRGRHGREARAAWRQQRWHQIALRARTPWLRAHARAHTFAHLRVEEERVDERSGGAVLGHRPRRALALGEHVVGRLEEHILRHLQHSTRQDTQAWPSGRIKGGRYRMRSGILGAIGTFGLAIPGPQDAVLPPCITSSTSTASAAGGCASCDACVSCGEYCSKSSSPKSSTAIAMTAAAAVSSSMPPLAANGGHDKRLRGSGQNLPSAGWAEIGL